MTAMNLNRNGSFGQIPHTPYFPRVDMADGPRLWTSARAMSRSGKISDILRALDAGGYLFAEPDRLLTWYGFGYEPALDRQHCGARLAFVLLFLAAPDAEIANLLLDCEGEC
jgi:hypothetical protein